jgi:hypothetical protein
VPVTPPSTHTFSSTRNRLIDAERERPQTTRRNLPYKTLCHAILLHVETKRIVFMSPSGETM